MKLADVQARLEAVPFTQGRQIIAIAGAPASGKSTLAEELARHMDNTIVLPMDGFHRDNDDLERHGLLSRKGAPETFDVAGFIDVVRAARTSDSLSYPTFDRAYDCVRPDTGQITAADRTILVEGNYLLLDCAPWTTLAQEWDFSVMLDVPLPVLQKRLVQRWLENGHDPDAALARAKGNDLPNAKLVAEQSRPAGLHISTFEL